MDIAPIQWKEWERVWWLSDEYTLMWCSSYYKSPTMQEVELPTHCLTELGYTSNGYRYTVYYKGKPLMSTIIRTPCCMQQGKCPVGKKVLPNTCRAYQRREAMKVAQVGWEQFVHKLAGGREDG